MVAFNQYFNEPGSRIPNWDLQLRFWATVSRSTPHLQKHWAKSRTELHVQISWQPGKLDLGKLLYKAKNQAEMLLALQLVHANVSSDPRAGYRYVTIPADRMKLWARSAAHMITAHQLIMSTWWEMSPAWISRIVFRLIKHSLPL